MKHLIYLDKSNLTKSVLALFIFVLYYCLTMLAFIPLADGDAITVTGYVLDLVNCPETWFKLCKFLLGCIILVPAIWIISGKQNVLKAWGLSEGIVKALIFSLVCVLPMLLCGVVFGRFEYSFDTFIAKAFTAGVVEEAVYRGFMFGMLFRFCNWGFWTAALPTAVIFSVGHFYQADDFLGCLMVFGVTAFGSIFFSWLYTAWKYNLYVPMFLHIFMNTVWGMLPIDGVDNSVGNIAANTGRVLTLLLAVIITCWYRKRNGEERWFVVENDGE
ncbi:MAG: CPBP family intramembrane metalloprotease [Bacteroidales bacterium]|nr:CPBP family intramembrane metalloprotease [Bacteroidales bacterium]